MNCIEKYPERKIKD